MKSKRRRSACGSRVNDSQSNEFIALATRPTSRTRRNGGWRYSPTPSSESLLLWTSTSMDDDRRRRQRGSACNRQAILTTSSIFAPAADLPRAARHSASTRWRRTPTDLPLVPPSHAKGWPKHCRKYNAVVNPSSSCKRIGIRTSTPRDTADRPDAFGSTSGARCPQMQSDLPVSPS